MVNAGKYLAKIVQYGVGESNNTNKPRIEIQFGFKDAEGNDQKLWWNGYLTDKSIKITAKALVVCGFKGSDYDKISEGIESGVLDTETPVEIDVQHETFEEKTRAKIAWINRPGGAQFMDPAMATKRLKGLNLGAAIAEARVETGIKEKKTEEPELPF